MYRNPLNNGNLSDYNSLKSQKDIGNIIKEYEKTNLKTEPNELQKYYQYLTYKQSILDELNYVSDRMKKENIEKQTSDFEFLEKLKQQREIQMKKQGELEELIKRQEELFNNQPKIEMDMTPTINTDLEIQVLGRRKQKRLTDEERAVAKQEALQRRKEKRELAIAKKQNEASVKIQRAFRNRRDIMNEISSQTSTATTIRRLEDPPTTTYEVAKRGRNAGKPIKTLKF